MTGAWQLKKRPGTWYMYIAKETRSERKNIVPLSSSYG